MINPADSNQTPPFNKGEGPQIKEVDQRIQEALKSSQPLESLKSYSEELNNRITDLKKSTKGFGGIALWFKGKYKTTKAEISKLESNVSQVANKILSFTALKIDMLSNKELDDFAQTFVDRKHPATVDLFIDRFKDNPTAFALMNKVLEIDPTSQQSFQQQLENKGIQKESWNKIEISDEAFKGFHNKVGPLINQKIASRRVIP